MAAITAWQSTRLAEAALPHSRTVPLDQAVREFRDEGIEYLEVHQRLGISLSALGRHAQAETAFRQALAIAPRHGTAQCGLGTLLFITGRIPEAEASLRESIRPPAEHTFVPTAHFYLASVFKATRRLAEAEASFRMAIGLSHESATPRALGRFSEARVICVRS